MKRYRPRKVNNANKLNNNPNNNNNTGNNLNKGLDKFIKNYIQGFKNIDLNKFNKRKLILTSSGIVLSITLLIGTVNLISSGLDKEPKKTDEELLQEQLVGYGIGINAIDSVFDAQVVREKLLAYDFYNDEQKMVFLTFDDGTHSQNTPKVLDILEKENVKATFFLNGLSIERGRDTAKTIIKDIYNEGHAIANHSYSHDYNLLYPNKTLNAEAFKEDFMKTDNILKDILGEDFSTRVIRCPGGEMSWKGMDNLTDTYNKISIDWNALTKDAEGRSKTADQLVQEAISSSKDKTMVVLLMHDTKSETYKALPQIIKHFKDNGYTFKTLA